MQIGVGRNRLILENVSPAQERFIDSLYYGVPEAQLAALAKQAGLSTTEATNLVDRLRPALTADAPAADSRTADAGPVAKPEIIRASLDHQATGIGMIAKRRGAAIHLDRLDPSGLTLLLSLAAAGIGSFTTRDNSRVTVDDIASNVYPRSLLGQYRHAAAKLILDSSWPGARLLYTNRGNDKKTARVDLAVLTHHQVTSPSQVSAWRTMSVPVIEIRYQPDGFEVSPVLTEFSGCLVCRDHFKQDLDDCHLVLCAQLLSSDLRFDDAASRLLACGLATQQILDFLDRGTHSAAEQVEFRYYREDGRGLGGGTRLEAKAWKAHPRCGCQITASSVLNVAS